MDFKVYDFSPLAICKTPDAIKTTLDDMGIDADLYERTKILNQFMGIGASYGLNDKVLTIDKEYGIAVAQLIAMNN
jgi:hypothetical protein